MVFTFRRRFPIEFGEKVRFAEVAVAAVEDHVEPNGLRAENVLGRREQSRRRVESSHRLSKHIHVRSNLSSWSMRTFLQQAGGAPHRDRARGARSRRLCPHRNRRVSRRSRPHGRKRRRRREGRAASSREGRRRPREPVQSGFRCVWPAQRPSAHNASPGEASTAKNCCGHPERRQNGPAPSCASDRVIEIGPESWPKRLRKTATILSQPGQGRSTLQNLTCAIAKFSDRACGVRDRKLASAPRVRQAVTVAEVDDQGGEIGR